MLILSLYNMKDFKNDKKWKMNLLARGSRQWFLLNEKTKYIKVNE